MKRTSESSEYLCPEHRPARPRHFTVGDVCPDCDEPMGTGCLPPADPDDLVGGNLWWAHGELHGNVTCSHGISQIVSLSGLEDFLPGECMCGGLR